jgi:hypothetical protein
MLPAVLAANFSLAASMSWTNPLGEFLIGELAAGTFHCQVTISFGYQSIEVDFLSPRRVTASAQ